MKKNTVSLLFILLILTNDFVASVYHWRLDAEGKKIRAVDVSPYDLAITGSLTEMMRQVQNMKELDEAERQIAEVMKTVKEREKYDNPDIEEEFMKTDSSCRKSRDLKLEPSTFQSHYNIEYCSDYHRYNQKYIEYVKRLYKTPPTDMVGPPKCQFTVEEIDVFGLRVSLNIRESSNKIRQPNLQLVKVLDTYFDGFTNFQGTEEERLEQHGDMIARLLSDEDPNISRHPYLLSAAAVYWKAKGGSANEAYFCYLTAYNYYKENSRNNIRTRCDSLECLMTLLIPLSALFNVDNVPYIANNIQMQLMKTFGTNGNRCFLGILYGAAGDSSILYDSESKEIKTFLKHSFVSAKGRPEELFTTVEMMMKSSLFFFAYRTINGEYGEQIDSYSQLMDKKSHLINCYISLFEELIKQRNNLEDLIKEKNEIKHIVKRKEELSGLIEKALASPIQRSYSSLFNEEIRYGPSRHRNCISYQIKNIPKMKDKNTIILQKVCNIVTNKSSYETSMRTARMSSMTNRPPINDTWRVIDIFSRSKTFENNLENFKKNNPDLVQFEIDRKIVDETFERPWRRADWPNSLECQTIVSSSNPFRLNTFPQIFISPETRGWPIMDLLTKHLTLSMDDTLPLPWYEPKCAYSMANFEEFKTKFPFSFLEKLLSQDYNRRFPKFAEKTLKTILVRLAERPITDFEMGARIYTLLKMNIGPRWIALNLAGLYWRVVGNPHQAIKCLLAGIEEEPLESDFAVSQLTQIVLKTRQNVTEAQALIFHQWNTDLVKDPQFYYIQGRLKLLVHEVDKAMQYLKDALDGDPNNELIYEDLLKIACTGKSAKPAISSQFPTVCCSPVVQNAVCIRPRKYLPEQCYVVEVSSSDENPVLVYHRCNGVYDGHSKKTSDFANIVSPFLPVFSTIARKDDVSNWVDDVDGVQTVEDRELPLDHGGVWAFFASRPAEWWDHAQNEMVYTIKKKEKVVNEWEEDHQSVLAKIPPKPLSFLWIREKSMMIQYDVKLPQNRPIPALHQIRRGVAIFPPPKSQMSCSSVAKLDVLFDNAVSTWLSLTSKGEDIEKYVDLKGPLPGISSLQPVCPGIDKYDYSPVLGLDHLPAFALKDQFLFYKPEKALTDALKSLGSDRDTIEHVAARLHAAMLINRSKDKDVNWLLCVLSSLYWRVIGDAENAMSCLRCALHTAPPQKRDVALLSLANVCHHAGLYNTALIAGGAALSISPNLVVIHFTLGNIYSSLGDYQSALKFYYSTLSLQSNFKPAKDRIRAIYCYADEEFEF